MMYRPAHVIYVGQWRFFPELMSAQNMHNGAPVYFHCGEDGTWVATGYQIPAPWMLTELCEWFAKWINGHLSLTGAK